LLEVIRVLQKWRVTAIENFELMTRELLKGWLCSLEGEHEVVLCPCKHDRAPDFVKNRTKILFWLGKAPPRLLQNWSDFVRGPHNASTFVVSGVSR
jgi:hypothetical protein